MKFQGDEDLCLEGERKGVALLTVANVLGHVMVYSIDNQRLPGTLLLLPGVPVEEFLQTYGEA